MSDGAFERSILDDGTTVITEHMDSVRSVTVGLWFAVGSRSELSEEAGMSHFLEHMMFKGTSTKSAADISEAFDRLGAELNAFTGKEYTCYFSRFVDEHLEDALPLLFEMVVDSVFAEDAIESEKQVVLEEIARRDDAPDDLVHDVLAGALWPGHPLGRPVLGSQDTVASFSRGDALDYVSRHYRTGDLVVAAAGNAAHTRVLEALGSVMTLEKGGDSHKETCVPAEPRPLAVVTKDTEQAHICWGVQALHANHPDRFALGVLDAILGGGMSSRLFQEIREKRGLAYAVYSYHSLFRETGSLAVYAGTRPSNIDQVVGIVREQTASMASDGVTPDELERAKESIKGQLVLGMESTRNRMTRLGKNQVTDSEILSLDELVERIDAVTADQVRELAARLFEGPAALALVGPFDEEEIASRLL
ncbi:MAG: pitrilysin family protein [Coriobacteriia bacterium]